MKNDNQLSSPQHTAIADAAIAVLDKKVIAWAGGDLSKINIDPGAKAKLEARWGAPISA